MNRSRRTFIQQTAMVIAGSTVLSKQLFAAASPKTITGIQLYSVRDDMKKDPLATLKALADMGYQYVEHANYINRKFYGYSATEFKKILEGYRHEKAEAPQQCNGVRPRQRPAHHSSQPNHSNNQGGNDEKGVWNESDENEEGPEVQNPRVDEQGKRFVDKEVTNGHGRDR